MCDGMFGLLFDLNHNGELDALERGAELGFLQSMLEEQNSDTGHSSDGFDDFDL